MGNKTYECDGVDHKDHDGAALLHSLFGLLNRLPCLHHSRLLLLEIEKIV